MQDDRAAIDELVLEYDLARISVAEEEEEEEEEEEANIVVSIRDVTQLRRAEEALRKSRETALRMAEEKGSMAAIGRIIGRSLKIEEVYEPFAEEVRKVLPFDRITINIIDHDQKMVTVPYVSGIPVPGRQSGDIFPLAGTFTEKAMRTGMGVILHL